MDKWKGRVALVTGASSVIGAAICKKLVKHEMTVVGCGRNFQKLQAVARDANDPNTAGKMYAVRCDFLEDNSIDEMFDEIQKTHGKVDVCINNAEFFTNDSLASGEPENWRKMLEVNIMGLCICTRKSLALMKEKGINDGVIIYMGSAIGHKVPDAARNKHRNIALGFYYGTKSMITGLAESLRQELRSGDSLIRVATISPGSVITEFTSRGLNGEAPETFLGVIRCLQTDHIAEAVINVLQTVYYDVTPVSFHPITPYCG